MVDVFISYSRKDRDRARKIADALLAEGFSVWWDHEIPPGKDYHEVIEEQISAARCVVVLWSETSVGSKFVRSEASEGDDRGVLIPVLIDKVKLPLAFKLCQTESLVGWTGGKDAEAWQRIVLQVNALARGQTAFKTVDRAGSTQQGRNRKEAPSRLSHLAPLLVGSFFLVLWALWYWAPKSAPTPFAITIGLAVMVFMLFRAAERDISPQMRALAAQWLLPNALFHVRTAEAFNHLFEAVFDRDHFSAKCFVRAALSSVLFLAGILILARLVLGSSVEYTPGTIISLVLFGGVVNVIGNYIALAKTRWLLRYYRDRGPILVIVIVDFVATVLLFVLWTAIAITVIYAILRLNGQAAFLAGNTFWGAVLRDLLGVIQQPYLDLFEPGSSRLLPRGQRVLIYSTFITMFLTSIWLWAALVLSPVIRMSTWAKGTGLSLLGFVFDVQSNPFAALGYLGALAVLVFGGLIWGTTEVVASLSAGAMGTITR